MLISLFLILSQAATGSEWKQVAPGMDIAEITARKPSIEGDSRITVVRIDPNKWELVFIGRSTTKDLSGKTVREWCESHNLTAAINAGMFNEDNWTHTGYLKYKSHINNGSKNNYQSVMAYDPINGKDLPQFRIYDLDAGTSIQNISKDYNLVIQNLRLIKKPGINVWRQQDRIWSEAAIGEDTEGRILFIYSPSPFSMHDLNKELLNAGIGIIAAQHLEGGPEAQLYLKAGGVEIELAGNYETSYPEGGDDITIWPIPNIIGVKPR
jgi:exopolysaccharide biosynthesis protein